MSFSYTLVIHDRADKTHSHPYTSSEPLVKGAVVLFGTRYWLVYEVSGTIVEARAARYRLSLRHPDGDTDIGAVRRFRSDAPIVGHRLATVEEHKPVSWVVMQAVFSRDDG